MLTTFATHTSRRRPHRRFHRQPLSQPVFRMLWIATVVSNVGSWMSDVGINWSMLTLSADPLDIALVQAASSLPMFLFALPSGVMADIVDRRKYLLFSQLWVFIAAAGLTALSFTGHVTPPCCWWRRFC